MTAGPYGPQHVCKWCGREHCKPTRGQMGDADFLTVSDWEKIYNFEFFVALPFMHQVLAEAYERKYGTLEPHRRLAPRRKLSHPQRVCEPERPDEDRPTTPKCKATGCNRKTKTPSGFCWQHYDMAGLQPPPLKE